MLVDRIVRQISFGHNFSLQTSTTTGVPTSQMSQRNYDELSTITATRPAVLSASSFCKLLYGQASKPLSCQVHSLWTTRTIQLLLPPRRPFDVAWLVVAVIVDSFNRMSWRWTWPYITVETPKTSLPFDTDTNSSPTIAMKPRVLGISTTLLHRAPYCVLGSVFCAKWADELTFWWHGVSIP